MSVILCTAGYDHTIRFWEALSGICSRTISHPDSQVNRLCISPDKRYLAAAGHHTIKLYDIKSSNPQPILIFEGHTNNVTGVAFHCEGKWMVTSSEDGTVRIWDTRTGNVQRNYSHASPVNDVVIHPNQGELISCDRNGTVRVWDLGENRCSHGLVPEEGVSVASVTVASDGSMLCAGNNKGTVFVWRMIQSKDITSIVPVCRFQAHSNYITRVLLSPDVRHLATCSADHTAKIWSVDLNHNSSQNGSHAGSLANSMVNSAVTDSSSSRATSESGYAQQRSQSQQRQRSYSGASPGDTTAAAMNGLSLNGPTMPVTNGQPNGVAGPDSSDSFPLETVLGGHQRWVWDCAFSADSAYLVTACSDHYARLWELSSQSIIRQYNGHHRGAVCVALNDTALG